MAASARAGWPAPLLLGAPQTTLALMQFVLVAMGASLALTVLLEETAQMQLVTRLFAHVWMAGRIMQTVNALAVPLVPPCWVVQRRLMASQSLAPLGRGARLVFPVGLVRMAPTVYALTKSMDVQKLEPCPRIARPTLYHSDNQLQIVPSAPYHWVEHTKAHARQRAVPLSNLAPPTLFHLDRRLQIARFLPFRSVEPTKASVRHRLDAHT